MLSLFSDKICRPYLIGEARLTDNRTQGCGSSLGGSELDHPTLGCSRRHHNEARLSLHPHFDRSGHPSLRSAPSSPLFHWKESPRLRSACTAPRRKTPGENCRKQN